MKNSLSDYFYDRLSTKEEEKVQKCICAGEGSEEFDCDLRSLFEECLETPRHNTARNFSFGRDIRKKLNSFSGCTTYSGPFMRYIQQDNPT